MYKPRNVKTHGGKIKGYKKQGWYENESCDGNWQLTFKGMEPNGPCPELKREGRGASATADGLHVPCHAQPRDAGNSRRGKVPAAAAARRRPGGCRCLVAPPATSTRPGRRGGRAAPAPSVPTAPSRGAQRRRCDPDCAVRPCVECRRLSPPLGRQPAAPDRKRPLRPLSGYGALVLFSLFSASKPLRLRPRSSASPSLALARPPLVSYGRSWCIFSRLCARLWRFFCSSVAAFRAS